MVGTWLVAALFTEVGFSFHVVKVHRELVCALCFGSVDRSTTVTS